MHMKSTNDMIIMIIIMIISGLLSTMNIWADKFSDIRFSLNDVYMTGLMTGWMLFFMGLWHQDLTYTITGFIFASVFFICIRGQVFINYRQYALGMIPHHSMAVHMSKQLLAKNEPMPAELKKLVHNIISGQEKEITILKN